MEYYVIKFYGTGDFANAEELKKCEKVFDDYENWNNYTDINKIIELYNVKKYIDTGIRLDDWADELYLDFQKKSGTIMNIIGKFFASRSINNLSKIHENIDVLYKEDFWEIIAKIEIYKKCSKEEFLNFLKETEPGLNVLLSQKDIVGRQSEAVSKYFLSDAQHAEFLVQIYLQKGQLDNKYRIPKELTNENKEELVIAYIKSDAPNLNYLRLIMQETNSSKLKLKPSTKIMARQKYKELYEKYSSRFMDFGWNIEVSFPSLGGDGKTIRDTSNENEKEFCIRCRTDYDWIVENLDYPTILNNLIYLIEITDKQGRCQLAANASKVGFFEAYMGVHGIKEYPVGAAFNAMNQMTALQMLGYCNILKKCNVDIEDVYKRFFEIYLKNEFDIDGFIFHPSSKGATQLEKNRNIAIEIESVLKQFTEYCHYGVVDRDSLEFAAENLKISDVPSLLENKYAYSRSEELQREKNLLYSAQLVPFLKNKETRRSFKNIVELLLKQKKKKDDFDFFQKNDLKWLISRKTILETDDGFLKLNLKRAYLIKELKDWDYLFLGQDAGKEEFVKEILGFEEFEIKDTLFSEPEQKYLNYLLNNDSVSNGMALRNRYVHATNSLSEHRQEMDYAFFLIAMSLIIIKINQEFCTLDELKKTK